VSESVSIGSPLIKHTIGIVQVAAFAARPRQRAAVGNDHRNLAAHQIGGERRSPLVAVRAGQPPRQRAIAQRFRALARMRPSAMSALTPLLGDKRTFR